MKKFVALIISVVMALSVCACGGGSTKAEAIELNSDNINEYVQFDGEFIDGKYTMGIVNYAEATLDFQAYPVSAGKFNNVKITLIATSTDPAFTYMNNMGSYWHLSDDDKDTKDIQFSFTLGVDGKFSKKYSVECMNNTGKLKGSSNFKVVSVEGTFMPD